jgi:hypothetical protein
MASSEGTATWLGAGELDVSQVAQNARVVADTGERLVERARHLHRARLAALGDERQ